LLEIPMGGDFSFEATSIPSRFPSLRSLTIRPPHNLHRCSWSFLPLWRLYMQAFPTVQHFTLIFYNMNGLLSALDKNMCSPQSLATSSFWPGL
jgi:hypothetical protein